MTMFARGVPALKRAVGAFTSSDTRVADWRGTVEADRADQRSLVAASTAERRAARAEYAWIDAAATTRLPLQLR